MSEVILNSTVDELLQLTHKERLDTLLSMSIEMLDTLAPTQLEHITFDWLRAYHATMYNCNYIDIKALNALAPQLRRLALHDIVRARDDRSFDRLDPLSVQWLRAIFNDRKAKAGAATNVGVLLAAPNDEFSVPRGFFVPSKKSWTQQADELHAGLERVDLASPDNPVSSWDRQADGLHAALERVNLDADSDNTERLTTTSDPGVPSSSSPAPKSLSSRAAGVRWRGRRMRRPGRRRRRRERAGFRQLNALTLTR